MRAFTHSFHSKDKVLHPIDFVKASSIDDQFKYNYIFKCGCNINRSIYRHKHQEIGEKMDSKPVDFVCF